MILAVCGLYVCHADKFTNAKVCFKYSFQKGDSLVYVCISHDSVFMPDRETILRDRKETIAIYCDSINAEGQYRINQKLVKVQITESGKDVKNQIRFDTPWLKRKIWYWMDSAGFRSAYGADDTTHAANSPGGAFQPQLFFVIGETCHNRKTSWNVDTTVDIPENSVPAPRMKYYSLFRNLSSVDTLGYDCRAGQYTMTAQGASHVITPDKKRTRLTSVIAQYGKFLWSNIINAPFHCFATIENKFSVVLDDKASDDKIEGKHYVNTNYTLTEVYFANGKKWKLISAKTK